MLPIPALYENMKPVIAVFKKEVEESSSEEGSP